jgi:Mrp family chromosome partitioning ATPase
MSLHRRSELLKRVAHLQELRRNGITTFAEAEHYKQAVAARSGKGKSASASSAAAAAAAAARRVEGVGERICMVVF